MVCLRGLLARLPSVSIFLAALAPVAAAQTNNLNEIKIISAGGRVKGLHYDAATSPGQHDFGFTFTVDARRAR